MKRIPILFLLVQMICLLSQPLSTSAQGWNIELLQQKFSSWHPAEVIACQGNYAYISLEYFYTTQTGGIAVVDISNPEDPQEISCFDVVYTVYDLEIVGNYLYIGYRDYGLSILDISNPCDLEEIYSNTTFDDITEIYIDGNYAYLGCDDAGLFILDISNPAEPVILSQTVMDDADEIITYQNIAYVCMNNQSIDILDISNPTNPVWLNNLSVDGNPHDIAISGDYLFTANSNNGIQVYDISDPQNPVWVEEHVVTVFGLIISNDLLYTYTNSSQLIVFDISNPTNLVVVGLCMTSGSLRDFDMLGDYIFAANDYYGLRPFDISVPSSPLPLAYYKPDWDIYDVELKDDYAFVPNDETGLEILDISDPTDMIQVASLESVGAVSAIDVIGDYAYLNNSTSGLMLVDISDPLNPAMVSAIDIDGLICQIDEETNRMYVSGDEENLQIYDITSLVNPVLLGDYYLYPQGYVWAWFNDIAVEGDMLCALAYYFEPGADGGPVGDSLLILDIVDPANPVLLSMTNLGSGAQEIEVRDNVAFIGASVPMLSIMDVSNPEDPQEISSLDFPGEARELQLHDDYVYILTSQDISVRVIDASILETPESAGYYMTPGSPYGMAVKDELLFVADKDYLESFNCSDALDQFSVAMTPESLPIVIPPGGGDFDCNLSVRNNRNFPGAVDGWVNIETPSGQQFTILGPALQIDLEAYTTREWDRTIVVPANAPAGDYRCIASIGLYPWVVDDQDEFTFTKEGTTGDWSGSEGWYCTGDLLPGEENLSALITPGNTDLISIYPNPFNPITVFQFDLQMAGEVKLAVYNVAGRIVANLIDGTLRQGHHEVTFDGSDLASGIYFVKFEAGEMIQIRKMVLIK